MSIETLTRTEFARERGYVDLDGNPSDRVIAQILREAMGRWGLSPRRALLKHARDQLRAGDVPVDGVPEVVERLVALGECAEVAIGNELFIAPAEPRWIVMGGGRAVLLGPLTVPAGISRVTALPPYDVAVRVNLGSDEMTATLDAGGWRQVSLEEWLQPCDYLRHVVRREGGPVRADQWGLSRFWERLVSALFEEGLKFGPDAEFRAVVGTAGSFFGRHTAATIEGRWEEKPPNGVWCAYRRGHGDNRWLPTLVLIDEDERRALDLFDGDEWRWALLARSKVVGTAEIAQRGMGEERVTWPLPAQLQAAMDIIGVPAGRWCWKIAEDAPDLWSLLR
jgi:hypothetical protein